MTRSSRRPGWRWLRPRYRLALIACVALWCVASVVALAAAHQAQPPASAPKPAEGQAKPADPKAGDSKPADSKATPKNRFLSADDEDDQDPAKKPGDQKAAPKNRFAIDDEETEPPKEKVFTYTGTRKCSRCHLKELNAYRNGPHGRPWDDRTPAANLGCETCHGPGQAHDDFPAEKDLVRTFTRLSPRDASAFCLKCHEHGQHSGWMSGMHEARNVTCINCHSIHNAQSETGLLKQPTAVETCAPCHRDKAAKMQRSSHMPVREGKMDCSSCHAVHGSTNVKLLRSGNTVNEACTKCHAEKRGPFLWDHAPVRENCTTCHDPHGSSNDRMLVAKGTMLCQRCHIGTRHPSTPYDGLSLANRNNRLINRGCVNCHSMIHGSNHPSGQFLAR